MCTHRHTNTHHQWTPLPVWRRQPGSSGEGVVVCRQESGSTRTDVSLAADRSDRSLCSPPSRLFTLSFSQSASLFYSYLLGHSHLHLPSTLNSDWPTQSSPLSVIVHLSHTFCAASFHFLSLTSARTNLPPQKAQAPSTKWNWSEVILLTAISRTELWKQNESKVKWLPNTDRHKVQPRTLCSESNEWVPCFFWRSTGTQW